MYQGIQRGLGVGFSGSVENAGSAIIEGGALKDSFVGDDRPTGDGLKGVYFATMTLSGPSQSRVDPMVDFDWGMGPPGFGELGADRISIRWTGRVEAPFTETYRFCTGTDDGARLWINRELLVDKWVDQAPAEWCGSIDLRAGQKYEVTMEYYENEAGAVAQLYWSSPSLTKAIIPKARLYSTTR
ncbi:MAG: hypothetical protein JJE39_13960, partial [Vicinamibacteria bacterium]|nr:hypothetical protein [Vicinamibacteria bacterium]